jgi:flavorubredoxin
LEKATGKEQTIGTDYNKYLVVQDTVKNKVFKKYAETAAKYEDNYQKEKLQ